jgi:hypothetical protein
MVFVPIVAQPTFTTVMQGMSLKEASKKTATSKAGNLPSGGCALISVTTIKRLARYCVTLATGLIVVTALRNIQMIILHLVHNAVFLGNAP